MLGTGMQLMTRNGDERFYSAARVRRGRKESNLDWLKRAQSDITGRKLYNKLPFCGGFVDEEDEKDVAMAVASPEVSLPQLQLPLCNLERFLKSIIPSVPVQYPSQTIIREWRACAAEIQPYFVLGDLFDSMKEWSAYGVGVPLVLNENFSVVQYYAPYLSGIQLYGDKSKSLAKSKQNSEDSDVDSFRDSSSDWGSDYENCMTRSIHLHKKRVATTKNPLGKNQLSLRDNEMTSPVDDFSSDESEPDTSQGCLLFEYFEKDNPYGREPLAEKISQLALCFPELKTLRSCDLLLSSWISVAWYPIYRIPMGHTLRDLDACFLTFHCLHTPKTGNEVAVRPQCEMVRGIPKIALPVFGLSCYKFNAPSWIPIGGVACKLYNSLLQAAEKWNTQLQVNHPDFLFFQRR